MFVISPIRRPEVPRIESIMYAVVVLPAVPVTPTTSKSELGLRKNATAAGPSARRTSATTSGGPATSSGRSTTSATAPAPTAAAAISCPSAREPRTQKKSVPGPTARVSYARSAISTGAGFRKSAGASAGASRSSCIPLSLAARPAVVWGYLHVLQVVCGDLREGRRGHDTAPDRVPRLVDHDEDDELRVRGRHHADERRDVPSLRVPAVAVRHLRRPGLPSDLVPGHGRERPGALQAAVL